jgi:hypothetical protein
MVKVDAGYELMVYTVVEVESRVMVLMVKPPLSWTEVPSTVATSVSVVPGYSDSYPVVVETIVARYDILGLAIAVVYDQ